MEYDKNIIELEGIYKILGNKHRLAILKYLIGRKEASVGDIANNLTCSFKATSHNLAILSRAVILKSKYDGPFVMYSIASNLPQEIHKAISSL